MTVKWTGLWPEVARSRVDRERFARKGWIACRHTGTWQPPIDVYENDSGIVVRVEAAGMRGEDFSISLAGHWLVIAGTRDDSSPKRVYHQMEIRFGEFRAEVYLPWPVEPEGAEASYEDGFLRIYLPRPTVQHVSVAEGGQKED